MSFTCKVVSPALMLLMLAGCNSTPQPERGHYEFSILDHINSHCTFSTPCINSPLFSKEINLDIASIEGVLGNAPIKTFKVDDMSGFIIELEVEDYQFEYGESSISGKHIKAMNVIARNIVGNKDLYQGMIVVGHASFDSTSTHDKAANLIESKRRAMNASNYLALSLDQYGFNKNSRDLIKSRGVGDAYSNKKNAGTRIKAKNSDQRIDLIFILHPTS
jgi:hypothetical protein